MANLRAQIITDRGTKGVTSRRGTETLTTTVATWEREIVVDLKKDNTCVITIESLPDRELIASWRISADGVIESLPTETDAISAT